MQIQTKLTRDFLKSAIQTLNQQSPDNWAAKFVELKMIFAREYQLDYIFSTRFGASFFENCLDWIGRNDCIDCHGEYDKNFNAWLKIIRGEK